MSVTYFDQNRINKILGMMKYRQNKIESILEDSVYFSDYLIYELRTNTGTFIEIREKAIVNFMFKMMWYAFVANKVAYALQYEKTVDFFEHTFNDENIEIIACSQKELFGALNHLIYNLHTNDGNMFMGEKWFTPLQDIAQSLAISEMRN